MPRAHGAGAGADVAVVASGGADRRQEPRARLGSPKPAKIRPRHRRILVSPCACGIRMVVPHCPRGTGGDISEGFAVRGVVGSDNIFFTQLGILGPWAMSGVLTENHK